MVRKHLTGVKYTLHIRIICLYHVGLKEMYEFEANFHSRIVIVAIWVVMVASSSAQVCAKQDALLFTGDFE